MLGSHCCKHYSECDLRWRKCWEIPPDGTTRHQQPQQPVTAQVASCLWETFSIFCRPLRSGLWALFVLSALRKPTPCAKSQPLVKWSVGISIRSVEELTRLYLIPASHSRRHSKQPRLLCQRHILSCLLTSLHLCSPQVLYQQFKFFLNLYFLVVACSQFVPSLKIGYLYTYWAPLVCSLHPSYSVCKIMSNFPVSSFPHCTGASLQHSLFRKKK